MTPTDFYKVIDNAYGQLNADIGVSDTSIALKAGDGARFPASADNNAIITVVSWDTSGTIPVVSKQERMTLTDRAGDGDTLTVTRSYDSDTAQTFSADDYVYLNVTEGVVEQIQTAVNTIENTGLFANGSNSMDNNTNFQIDNAAGTPVSVFKMTTGDVFEFQTLPRNPSSRSISNDYDLVDKKYGDDNWSGNTVAQKAEAAAASGEVFENTDEDGESLAWKSTGGDVWDVFGPSFTYGENISANDAVTIVGEFTDTTNRAISDDTYVDGGNPTTNYGTSGTLEAGYDGDQLEAYFHMPSLPSGLLRIISFDLMIYVNSETAGAGNVCEVFNPASWVEGTVVYNTKPASANGLGYFETTGVGWNTIAITVSSDAISTAIIANGVALKATSPTNGKVVFDSGEGTNAPYIDNLVYLGTDGKIYKARALYTATAEGFIGFTKKAGVLDDKQPIYKIGEFVPVTCTIENTYYLSDTAGAIATSAGTVSKKVGYAAGTDLLQVRIDNN